MNIKIQIISHLESEKSITSNCEVKNILTLNDFRRHSEKTLIEHTLELCRGNVSKAARVLDLNRGTLRKKISAYDMRAKELGRRS